jgi:hypothetical protein
MALCRTLGLVLAIGVLAAPVARASEPVGEVDASPPGRSRRTRTDVVFSQGGDVLINDGIVGAVALTPTAYGGGRPAMIGLPEVEHNYAINGHGVADPSFGTIGSRILAEFINDVEILAGGYDAEYGWASGAQVLVRRRRGSRGGITGAAGFRFTPRLAAPRSIGAGDEAMRVTEVREFESAAYALVSGRLGYRGLFFTVGVNASDAHNTLTQQFRRVDGGPSTKKFAEQTFKTRDIELGWVVGLDWSINARHVLGLTAVGGPSFSRTSYRLPFAVDPVAFGTNPDTELGGTSRRATGIVNDHFGWDLDLRNLVGLEYGGRAFDDRLWIDARLSYWQGTREMAWRLDDPGHKQRPATQVRSAGGRNLLEQLEREDQTALVPGVRAECGDDRAPGNPCPVRTWVSGGLGKYDRDVSRRVQASLAFTHLLDARAAGSHQIKWGAETAWLQRDSYFRYSGSNSPEFAAQSCAAGELGGGEYCYNAVDGYRFDRSTRVNNHRYVLIDGDNPEQAMTFGYGATRRETGELRALVDPAGYGVRVAGHRATVSTLNYALFLQDRWMIRPNLVVSAGVRWEIQDLRDIHGRSQLRIGDNVAPRLGVVYDWTGEGKSRLFAHYGWYYQPLPLQLNSRSFGGLVHVARSYRPGDCDDSRSPSEWCVDTGGFTTGTHGVGVAPGLHGGFNHRLLLGYEHALLDDLFVNLRWLHQDLGRAVEDVSTNGGLDFMLVNPGVAIAESTIAAQADACDTLRHRIDAAEDEQHRAALGGELRRCEHLVDAYRRLGSMFPKPVRTLDAWTIQVFHRFAKGWSARASYTYARQVGNYEGFVDPDHGAINLGASAQWDTPELVRNSFGPLRGTVPHMLDLDAFYLLDLRRSGWLILAASLRHRSGAPINVRSDTTLGPYRGQDLIYLLPRGAGGRLAGNTRLNLTASYVYWLPRDISLEFTARVINVTNARAVLRVDEVYSFDGARAIAGGELGDLAHAKIHGRRGDFFAREIVRPQGNYGVETQFQQPVSAQFELAFWF